MTSSPALPMIRRVNGFALIVDDERGVLLTRWLGGRRPAWTLPGGVIRDGEDPRDAAIRGVMRETGLSAEVASEPYAVASRTLQASKRPQPQGQPRREFAEDLHIINILYRATVTAFEPHQPDGSGMIDQVAWFPLDAVPPQRLRYVTIALERAGLARP